MNARKNEVVALLGLIEKAEADYSGAVRAEERNRYDLARLFVAGAMPACKGFELRQFESRDWYGNDAPRYEFSFDYTPTGSGISVALLNRQFVEYSVTGWSDRGFEEHKVIKAIEYYNGAAQILSVVSSREFIEAFYNEIVPQFANVKWADFSVDLDKTALQKELREIELAEKAKAINLSVGSTVQYYFTSNRFADRWIVVKVLKVTPKTFKYVSWNEPRAAWIDEYYADTAKIDYNRLNILSDAQREMIAGK